MNACPCQSQKEYSLCCGLYIDGHQPAPSPEALMRSRYCAYSMAKIDYIVNTMRGNPLNHFNAPEAKRWAQRVNWLGLKIIHTRLESSERGFIEFIASLLDGDKLHYIHENSVFQHQDGQWFYVDTLDQKTQRSPASKKIARNSLCPCASGNKFKNCHARI